MCLRRSEYAAQLLPGFAREAIWFVFRNSNANNERRQVPWPATIEDASVVEVARAKVAEYFREKGGAHQAIEARAKL